MAQLYFRRFFNPAQQRFCYIPSGRYGNFLLSVKKLMNYCSVNWQKMYIAHVTLTLAEASSSVDTEHINRVMDFIRKRMSRRGTEVKYLWVKEMQEKRLKERGELAIHFHLMVVYSRPYALPSTAELARSWKLGFVKVTAPTLRKKPASLISYLGKYVGKGYDYGGMQTERKSHSASQIPAIYRKPARVVASLLSAFAGLAVRIKGYFVYGDFCGEQRQLFSIFGQGQWYYVDTVPEPF